MLGAVGKHTGCVVNVLSTDPTISVDWNTQRIGNLQQVKDVTVCAADSTQDQIVWVVGKEMFRYI